DALYGVRESLDRRQDRLQYGRGLLTIDAAISLDETRMRSLRESPDETRELEPASESLKQARDARDAAARAAALGRTLESADVALTSGGPLGGGATERTLTLDDLRGLEILGRALWFEAVPDPRTGLRRAVPAVAARWRDPAELVLVVNYSGAVPAPGRYPTLESLL